MPHARRSAAAALIGLALAAWVWPAASLAAGPTFSWEAPQVQARQVPTVPFERFARFAAGEEIQRFYFTLQAGTTENLSLLVPAGDPPVALAVRGPDGTAESLPPLPAPQRVWLGPIPLDRVLSVPYPADATGIYVLNVQPGTQSGAEAYALTGNWTGSPLGRFGPGAALLAPVTLLRALIWRWG